MKLQPIIYTLLLSVFSFYSSFGDTFTVTNPSSDPTIDGSLPFILKEKANTNGEPDLIIFDDQLQGATISIDPGAYTPRLDDDETTIDGVNTKGEVLQISIITEYKSGGASSIPAFGMLIYSNNNTIRNIRFNNDDANEDFSGKFAIYIDKEAEGNHIEDCIFGLDWKLENISTRKEKVESGAIVINGSNNFITNNFFGGYVSDDKEKAIAILIEGDPTIPAIGNQIYGNKIGTGVKQQGTFNNDYGIIIRNNASINDIGGPNTGEENIIVSSNVSNILIEDANDNTILNNYIGTNLNGDYPGITSSANGIEVKGSSKETIIGSFSIEHANVIGNNNIAIHFSGDVTDAFITHNYIGTSKDLEKYIPNSTGIDISGGGDHFIGNNQIRNNFSGGISLLNTDNAVMSQNEFQENFSANSPIKLVEANSGIDMPSIDHFDRQSSKLHGFAEIGANVEVYMGYSESSRDGIGEKYLGSVTATDGTWSFDIPSAELDDKNLFSATQTVITGTSEFGVLCFGAEIKIEAIPSLICGDEVLLELVDINDPTNEAFTGTWDKQGNEIMQFPNGNQGASVILKIQGNFIANETIIVDILDMNANCSSLESVDVFFENIDLSAGNDLTVYDNSVALQGSSNSSPVTVITDTLWEAIGNNAIITNPLVLNTNAQNLDPQENDFVLTLMSDAGCTYQDTVTHTFLPANIQADAGEDQITCSFETQLDGSFPGYDEIGIWQVIDMVPSTVPAPSFLSSNTAFQTPEEDPKAILQGLENDVVYTIARFHMNPFCDGTFEECLYDADTIIIDNRKIPDEPSFYFPPLCGENQELQDNYPFYPDFNYQWSEETNTLTFSPANNTITTISNYQEGNTYQVLFTATLGQCYIESPYFFEAESPVIINAGDDIILPYKTTSQEVIINASGNDITNIIDDLSALLMTESTAFIDEPKKQGEQWSFDINNIPLGESVFNAELEGMDGDYCFVTDSMKITRRLFDELLKDTQTCGPSFSLTSIPLQNNQSGVWLVDSIPTGANIVDVTFGTTILNQTNVDVKVAGTYKFIWEVTDITNLIPVVDYDTVYYTIGLPLTDFKADLILDTLILTDDDNGNIISLDAINSHVGVTGTWTSNTSTLYFENGTATTSTNPKTITRLGNSLKYTTFYWVADDACNTIDSLTIGVIPSVIVGENITGLCQGDTALSGGTTSGKTSLEWKLITPDPTNAVSILNPNAPTTTAISITTPGIFDFMLEVTSDSDPSLKNSDIVTVEVIDAFDVFIPVDTFFVSLAGRDLSLNSGESDVSDVIWTAPDDNTIQFSDANAPFTFVTKLKLGANKVVVTDTDECPSKDSVILFFERKVSIDPIDDVCDLSTQLNGNIEKSHKAEWSTVPNGGTGTGTVIFDNFEDEVTTVSVSDTGSYTFKLKMFDPDKINYDSTTVTVHFRRPPVFQYLGDLVTTTDSAFISMNDLEATNPIGSWVSNPTGEFPIKFKDENSTSTVVYNLVYGDNDIFWEPFDNCDAQFDVTILRNPEATILTTDTVYCQGDQITLLADDDFEEGEIFNTQGGWFTLDGIPVPNSTNSMVFNANASVDTSFVWYVGVIPMFGEGIPIAENADTINIKVLPYELATISLDTIITFTPDVLLDATSTIGGMWSSNNPTIEFDDASKTNAIADKLPVGYTKLYWTTGTDDCESEDSIIVFRRIEVIAGDSIESCSPNIVLNGNPPIGAQIGKWTSTSTTVEIENDTQFDTKITFKEVEEALFIWTISENGFEFSDSVIVEALELDTANAGLDFSTTVDSVQVSAALGDISSVMWTTLNSVSNVIIKNPFSVITDITNLEEGENVFILLDNDIDCPSQDILKIVYTDKQFIAKLDTVTINEDDSTVVNVSLNDIDLDKQIDLTTLNITTQPSNGLAKTNTTTGEITYIPNPNFNGKDSLIYQLCSSINGCDTAYVIIDVTPVNDPFVAMADTVFVDEDQSITFDVSTNDIDIDGDIIDLESLKIISSSITDNGDANITSLKEIMYTPSPDFNGKDSLIYELCSTDGTCDTAYIRVNIAPIDDPIVANLDQIEVSMNGQVIIDVAENDFDIDGDTDTLTVTIAEMANHGIAIVNSTNGHITYEPTNDFFGKDSLIYEICNQHSICDTAYLKITVSETILIAELDTVTVSEDDSVTVNVIANDIDPDNVIDLSTLSIIKQPKGGLAKKNTTAGEVTYIPTLNFNGIDSLIYEICSTNGICDTAYLVVNVTPVDDPFVAMTDKIFVDEDQSITFDVSTNDFDIDKDLFDFSTLEIISTVNHGNATITVSNEITYTPDPNFNGKDSLIYQLCSEGGTCDTAYVKINIAPINDSIIANLDQVEMGMNGQITVNVIENDIDVDVNDLVDALSVQILTLPDSGLATVDINNGNITYEPNLDFFGKDSLVYQVCSSDNTCDTAYLKITVSEKLIAKAGNDTTFCGLETKLNAEAVTTSGYTAYWNTEGINNITIDNNNPTSDVEFATSGTYELIWVIENNGVIESQDTVELTSLEEFDASILSNNGENIKTNESTLSLSGDANGSPLVKWSVNTSAMIDDTTQVNINISNLALGENIFTFQTGDVCPSDEEIIVTYFNPFVADAGDDIVICTDSLLLAAAPIPSDAKGKWIPLLVSETTITNDTLSSTWVTNLPHKKIGYIWEVSNGFETKSDTILIGVSLESPIPNLIENVTIETEYSININPNKVPYNTYVYEVIEQKDSIIGTIIINNNTDSLSYIVNKAALGYDTIIYTITDQCGRSTEDTISFFIQNSAPLEGDAFATAETGSIAEFNVLDSIYIFDKNYNINAETFIFFDEYSKFGAKAESFTNGDVSLDYSYITQIGTDSLRYQICDDSSRCLEAYLKINVIPSEGINEASVTVYNVISPNDDDKHDFLLIENLNNDNGDPKYPDNKLTIFDRWGHIVTTIKGYDNGDQRWAGKDESGDLVPQGTYYYAFQLDENLFISGFIIVNYE